MVSFLKPSDPKIHFATFHCGGGPKAVGRQDLKADGLLDWIEVKIEGHVPGIAAEAILGMDFPADPPVPAGVDARELRAGRVVQAAAHSGLGLRGLGLDHHDFVIAHQAYRRLGGQP